MSYEQLIEAMIDRQGAILGDRAVEIARGVRGLHLASDGTVDDLSVDGKVAVDDLLSAYVDALGPAARGAMSQVAEEYGELDLPPELTE